MKSNYLRTQIVENINPDLPANLRKIGIDFFDSIESSELYSRLTDINMSYPDAIYGHIDFDDDGRKTRSYNKDMSISAESYKIKSGVMEVKKDIVIGVNTNRAVEWYRDSDHIAPSVNNHWFAVEEFKVDSADDVLDVIDEVSQRTFAEHVNNLGEIIKKGGNGRSIDELKS